MSSLTLTSTAHQPTEPSSTDRWTLGWGFTTRCDLACPFCYSLTERRDSQVLEVPVTLAENFLAANSQYIHAINFGTGESSLSPMFPTLLALCGQYVPKADVAVTTNGAFIELSSDALSLVARHITECDVSLDFAQEAAHDGWRGRSGTWRRAIKAIELALTLGLRTSLVMIGTAQTLTTENLRGLFRIAEQYQVPLRINLYMPTTDNRSFLPTRESVFSALALLTTWSSAVRSSDRLIGQYLGMVCHRAYSGPRRSCQLLPSGHISPSTYLLTEPWLVETTLADTELPDLLNTDAFTRYTFPPIPSECCRCPAVEQCKGGSVERRWLWAHSLYVRDPLCPHAASASQHHSYASPRYTTDDRWLGPKIHLDYLPTIVAIPPVL